MTRDFTISNAARSEAIFQRQQSLDMRGRNWETRIRPMRSWLSDIGNGAILIVFLTVLFIAADLAATKWGG